MTDKHYDEVRKMRAQLTGVIGAVESWERAELWYAIDQLDAWLTRHAPEGKKQVAA